ncbi:MAG: zinc ribbon domain-containing protein [Deltaproteobacteria bacterium]|nr:zinc ribbon domain-containing protein [Deltaproteobacteria bacterium]
MPIFEFRCLKCGNIFEKLFTSAGEEEEITCPACQSDSFERVVSRTNYTIGAGPGGNQPKITAKSCGPSSQCMTLDLPGPSK